MSPDWSDETDPVPYASLENPQTLNLYSYVENNPLDFKDASGHSHQECKQDSTSSQSGGYSLFIRMSIAPPSKIGGNFRDFLLRALFRGDIILCRGPSGKI